MHQDVAVLQTTEIADVFAYDALQQEALKRLVGQSQLLQNFQKVKRGKSCCRTSMLSAIAACVISRRQLQMMYSDEIVCLHALSCFLISSDNFEWSLFTIRNAFAIHNARVIWGDRITEDCVPALFELPMTLSKAACALPKSASNLVSGKTNRWFMGPECPN